MERAARRIVDKLRSHGHEAFFAGGCVRDLLLRRKPQYIDIATSAVPEQVRRLFSHTNLIGARYGVVQVRLYGHPVAGGACAGTTVVASAGGTVDLELAPGTAIAIDITTRL